MSRTLKARGAVLSWYSVALVAGSWALLQRESLILVAALSVLAGIAFLGRRFSIIHWPIGLAATVLSAYVMYVWSWFRGIDGISQTRAEDFFVALLCCFGVVAMFRILVPFRGPQTEHHASWRESVPKMIVLALPVLLMVFISMRASSDPVRVISGHLSGGDHGAHNLIIHRLIDPSAGSELVSPAVVYAYPRAIHYLIALMTTFDDSFRHLPTVAAEYLSAARFEYLQLAAFIQSSLVVLLGRKLTVSRAIVALAAVVFAMSIDNFVSHLFWSGFTTSLAISWILMLPIALSFTSRQSLENRWQTRTAAWILFSLLCWVVYQPFVIVGLVLALSELLETTSSQASRGDRLKRLLSTGWCVPVLASMVFVLFPLFVGGRQSPAVTSLLMSGSLYRSHLWTVVVLVVLSSLLLGIRPTPVTPWTERTLYSVIGVGLGSILVVRFAGGPGLTDQPYYVQKIFWVFLYLSGPVILSITLDLLDRSRIFSRTPPAMVGLLCVSVFVLAPMATDRSPAAATRHFSVDWFAAGLVRDHGPVDRHAVAFSMRDKLGSHLANLSLQGTSSVRMAVETSLSGNPYLACREITANNAELVYTTPNGRAELVESGCSPSLLYLEDGTTMPNPWIPYFRIRSGIVEETSRTEPGFRFLLRGFRPPQTWGTWAGGYRSALGFTYDEAMKEPVLSLKVRSYPDDPEQRSVVIRANDREVGRKRLAFDGSDVFEVPLPAGVSGTRVELTITCERSDQEVLADDPVDGPDACMGLESITLDEGSPASQ